MRVFTDRNGSIEWYKPHRLETQILTLDNIAPMMSQFLTSSVLLFPMGLDGMDSEDDISIVVLVMPTDIFCPVFGDKIDRGYGTNSILSPDELAAFVQYEHQYKPLRFEGMHIDPACREVVVDGKLVSLPRIEFELLWFLARHPRQVFTREQLLNCVWGYDYTGGESTVTVHIRRLRKKVEPNPANPTYIHTIWGVGYKFEVF